jgi:aconitase B
MKNTQGWGWLAAGVLALGLNGFYQDGGAAWAHRAMDGMVEQVADRTRVLADLATERVDRVVESGSLVAARDETTSCRLASAMALFQGKIARTQGAMARMEAMSARQEEALARVEANRARIEARVARLRLAPVAFNTVEMPMVACPRLRVNVLRVPRAPMVRIPAPVMQVETAGGGPI